MILHTLSSLVIAITISLVSANLTPSGIYPGAEHHRRLLTCVPRGIYICTGEKFTLTCYWFGHKGYVGKYLDIKSYGFNFTGSVGPDR